MPGAAAALPAQVSPPEFALSAAAPSRLEGVPVVAVPVLPGERADEVLLGPGAAALAEDLGVDLLTLLDPSRPGVDRASRAGEVLACPVAGEAIQQVLLVGVGEARPQDLRRAGAAVAQAGKGWPALATSVPAVAGPDGLAAFVSGAMLGSFGFHWRSEGPAARPVARVVLCGSDGDDAAEALRRGLALGGAGWLARTLATVPSNLKSPAWLAQEATRIATDAGLEATVWSERELVKQGMGGLVAVGRGSATPPRLIRLDYTPARATRRTPRVVLVGKGITFDSGGLSIKPAELMANMKRDMTGGAVVIAVMSALAEVGCPVRVTGLVAAAENAVGGDALRPDDVITHYGGRTTEVTNTDAEGRLVLADALAYAAAELRPAALVDVATLTGAMKISLGQSMGGLFATDDTLAARLLEAGAEAGEPLWRFPLVRDYADKLTSMVADADNAPGGAGAITAALFLEPFVGKVPWAHLDIASVGDSPKDRFEWTEGPTGFGARALLTWLGSPDPVAGIGR